MRRVSIEFEADNAAFVDDPEGSLNHIFAQAAKMLVNSLEHSILGGKVLWDLSGNQVGWVSVLEE